MSPLQSSRVSLNTLSKASGTRDCPANTELDDCSGVGDSLFRTWPSCTTILGDPGDSPVIPGDGDSLDFGDSLSERVIPGTEESSL